MCYNEGNEWKNPKASALELQLKSNMEKMLRDRAAVVGLDDTQTAGLVILFNTMYSTHFEPGLKSMLQDINQYIALIGKAEQTTSTWSCV